MTDPTQYQFKLPANGAALPSQWSRWGRTPGTGAAAPASSPAELPEDAAACLAQGNTWLQAGRVADALRAYDRAIALQPDYLDPHFNRGNALLRLQRPAEALAAFERAAELSPTLVIAHYNCGTVLEALGRPAEAMAAYERALALEPAHVQARFNLGTLYLKQDDHEQALACMDAVLEHAPTLAQAHNNRGTALIKLGRLAEAEQSLSRALQLQPRYAEALSNRGNARIQLKRRQEAAADLRAAIALNPAEPRAYQLFGGLCRETGRRADALKAAQKAYELAPDAPGALIDLIGARTAVCDWRTLAPDLNRVVAGIEGGRDDINPFTVLGLLDAPALQLACARQYCAREQPPNPQLGKLVRKTASTKIRVGYYSADLHDHATAYLMAELFERHDHDGFEWFAFSFGPHSDSAMRQRLRRPFERFLDVRAHSDREVAQLSRELGIDIAVDLKGFTQDSRMGIFARRCAPVQVSYLGYPGTTGAPYMDYVIADRVVLPPALHAHFSEKVVTLPHSYQVNDAQRHIAERVFTREEVGLPPEGFVFCCFNNNYKILPATFDAWMRILAAVPGSVLWLLEDSALAASNLRREAQARGIDAARLVFAARMPLAEHLARHRLADLFIDTLPCNAHTTTSDALWAGLPVLTLAGQAFAGRVAASLLTAVGLPELVTTSAADYEARAIALARDPAQLRALRERLWANRATAPLFDARLFARHLEAAFVAMNERSLQNLPPAPIEIRA